LHRPGFEALGHRDLSSSSQGFTPLKIHYYKLQ
jgi:hypothetical protein